MIRIYDSNQQVLPTLRQAVQQAHHVDICTPFFNLSGWDKLMPDLHLWGLDWQCRLLIGMFDEKEINKIQQQQSTTLRVDQVAKLVGDKLTWSDPLDERGRGQLQRFYAALRSGRITIAHTNIQEEHSKLYLIYNSARPIPDRFYLGSVNLTAGGLRRAGEMSVEISDPQLCAGRAAWFNARWQASMDITYYLVCYIEWLLQIPSSVAPHPPAVLLPPPAPGYQAEAVTPSRSDNWRPPLLGAASPIHSDQAAVIAQSIPTPAYQTAPPASLTRPAPAGELSARRYTPGSGSPVKSRVRSGRVIVIIFFIALVVIVALMLLNSAPGKQSGSQVTPRGLQASPPPPSTVFTSQVSATSLPVQPTSTAVPADQKRMAKVQNLNSLITNLHQAVGNNAHVIARLAQGTRVELLPDAQVNADGYQWQRVMLINGTKGWIVTRFLVADKLTSLSEFTRRQQITAASITAIGMFTHTVIGYFVRELQQYRPITISESAEVISLLATSRWRL